MSRLGSLTSSLSSSAKRYQGAFGPPFSRGYEMEKKKPGPKPKLIKMVRPDGKTADVHPSEVENYKLGDYKVLETR